MPAEQGKPKLERKTYRESATMFEEMASGMSRNRYPRSGPASTILAWPMLLQPLPQKRIFPRVAPAFIGSGADSACKKKASFAGTRKRKRRELNSAECGSRKQATRRIARAETKLHTLGE